MLGSPQTAEQETQRRRAEAELAAQIQQVNAQNRMLRCNFARRQLGVLKGQRPAYSHDNNGDRHYVEDDQRAAETASWEKRVAAECQ